MTATRRPVRSATEWPLTNPNIAQQRALLSLQGRCIVTFGHGSRMGRIASNPEGVTRSSLRSLVALNLIRAERFIADEGPGHGRVSAWILTPMGETMARMVETCC